MWSRSTGGRAMSKEDYRKARAELLEFGEVFRLDVEEYEDIARTYSASAAVSRPMMRRVEDAPDIVTGRQVREGRRQGARISNERHKSKHIEYQYMADEYWSRRPEASKSEVATWIARRTGAKKNTVRQVIMRSEKT